MVVVSPQRLSATPCSVIGVEELLRVYTFRVAPVTVPLIPLRSKRR